MAEPFIDDDEDHDACWFCPALRFPREGFIVADRPSRCWPFDPADGYRYTADGTPVCVHPAKVGLPVEHLAPTLPPEPPPEPAPAAPTRRAGAGIAALVRWLRAGG